jgi:hypothetical protein
MRHPDVSTFASRLGTIIFFLSCLLAVPPVISGVLLLLDLNWQAWIYLSAVGVAIVFASSTINFILSGCFFPGCRS